MLKSEKCTQFVVSDIACNPLYNMLTDRINIEICLTSAIIIPDKSN